MNFREQPNILYIPWWGSVEKRTIFFILSGTFLSLFFLYVFFVHSTVSNVIAQTNSDRKIAAISGQLGDMESTYLSLAGAVTLDLAYSEGFQNVTPVQYISRGNSLSYNDRR